MIYKELHDNPENYLFRYVLVDHCDDYLSQGWEVVGTMQNRAIALNSVWSLIMVFRVK